MFGLVISFTIVAFQAVIGPPDAVRAELNGWCAGWRLAAVMPEVAEEIRARTPSWPPNLIPGDFNADGRTDLAMLVDCKGQVQLFAFVVASQGFTTYTLDQPQPLDPRQFLHLIRKDYGSDAIGVEFEAIGGRAWVWRDGRWQSVGR